MFLKTRSVRMATVPALYDMQTTYFGNVLEGIIDKDAHERLNTKANHIAWLAGSLVQQRFELACLLDNEIKDHKQQADELFSNNQGLMDGVTYPPLDQLKEDWKTISPLLRDLLVNVRDEQLDNNIEMPGMSFPTFDFITFMCYREANCIGQIALWRRLLGYEAMKYM